VFFIFLWMSLTGFILAEEKININTASHEKLQKIVWVGPVTAQKIIEARPFYSLDEIIKVSGIGDKKLEDIKNQGLAWAGPITDAETTAPPDGVKEKDIAGPKTPETTLKTNGSPLIIDINTASLQELQKIVGVGAVLSQRIIEARPFYSLNDLLKVSGIGQTTLENIKSQGLAWTDPVLSPPKTEFPDKEIAATDHPQLKNKKLQESPHILLIAFFLSFFSGTTALILKKSLKKTS